MANLLLIDTTSRLCSVSIACNDEVIGVRESDEHLDHAAKLTSYIQEVLKDTSLKIEQLDAIAISAGPGSYTGLRIGVSTAKGLCYALNIPLIAVDTLYSLASQAQQTLDVSPNELLVPIIDSRKEEIYAAIYDSSLKTILEPTPIDLRKNPFQKFLQNHDLFFFGQAINKVGMYVKAPSIRYSGDISHSSVNLATSAYKSYQIKAFKNLIYFEPLYLKDVYITVKRQ